MSPRRFSLLLALGLAFVVIGVSKGSAQIKPASSGDLSYNAPEMRRHASGLYRPNRMHRHHHHHGHFFR